MQNHTLLKQQAVKENRPIILRKEKRIKTDFYKVFIKRLNHEMDGNLKEKV